MNINLTDGQAHDIAVYALDWPDYGRSEQIQVSSASTGAVLDTETISNFNDGLYLQWQITGNVIIKFSGMGGTNAVLSGLFFDPPTQPFDVLNISSPSATDTAGTAQTFTVTAIDPNGQTDTHYTGTIHFSSTDPHAVLPANYTFTAADAGVHTFSATLETAGTQSVTATDTSSQSTTGSESNISVIAAAASSLTVTGFPNPDTAGAAGTFTVTAYDPYGNIATGYAGTVYFTSSDPQASLPAGYSFTAADAGKHTFSATLKTAGTQSVTATDTASQSTTGTEPNITVIAAAASSLTVTGLPNPDTAGEARNFTVTAYDPCGNIATGYTGTVHFTSTDPQAVLPANYTFTAADAGVHTFSATLETAGTQSVTATDTASASVTGTTSVTVASSANASAALVKRDSTTEGNWIGAYGSQGYNIIGNAANYPSYATVSVAGETATTWAATTNDPRALQTPGGASRIAACWYSGTSFTVNINLTDGQAHDIAVYALDWPDYGRSEQIQVSSASTRAVLDTETISNFNGGLYLQWQITGNVIIRFSGMGGTNAVLSGLFFDGLSTPPPATATLVKRDATTEGNWIGVYGSQGYNIFGGGVNCPSYATVSATGASATTWAATTNDPRALETPSGAGRIAVCWYSSTSFSVNINLTDGQAHDIAVYALDWPDYGRSEQIQVSSAGTGAVLDTETISNFNDGLYLQWQITGNVVIQFSGMGGTNAVLSGLFFDPVSGAPAVALASLPGSEIAAQGNSIGAYDNTPTTDEIGTLDFSSSGSQGFRPPGYTFLV